MKKRVLLWMSGWIDSTVCAYLLKEQGYDVVWVFMRYWVDPSQNTGIEKEDKISENKCCSLEAQNAAKQTCEKLWIEFHVYNVREKFYENVVKYFLLSHKKWLTPNPCIICNKQIKWWNILSKLKKFNCDMIATWHYARILEKDWKLYAAESLDKKKDQSYFMSVLSHNNLKKIIFPIWEMNKDDVRILAKKYWENEVFKKKESQWVCFFNEDSYIPFLKRNIASIFKTWEFIFIWNKWKKEVIWKHIGLPYYTIWQRKLLPWGFEKAIYVIGSNKDKNQILLWYDEDLWKKEIKLSKISLLSELKSLVWTKIKKDYLHLRIRHLWRLSEIHQIKNCDNWLMVILKTPIRAITPGQFAVFYCKDGRVLWNGLIE